MEKRDAAAPQATAEDLDLKHCRFYEREFPEKDEVVMVKVVRIGDMGTYVHLLEYCGKEGMVLMSELSKRRFRSVRKLIKVGRHEAAKVLRVDESKGYIDLSKRRVSPEDIIRCEEKYSAAKKIHQTVRHIARLYNYSVPDLCQKFVWPMYRRFGEPANAVKELSVRPEEILLGCDLPEEVRNSLLQDIKMRLTPQSLRMRVIVDVWCFGKDGVDAVKAALRAGHENGNGQLSITLKAPPGYMISHQCFNKETGIQLVERALEAITEKIRQYPGGDAKKQGEIVCDGGEDKHLEAYLEDEDDEEEDSDESGSEDEEEEDNCMGAVDEVDLGIDPVEFAATQTEATN